MICCLQAGDRKARGVIQPPEGLGTREVRRKKQTGKSMTSLGQENSREPHPCWASTSPGNGAAIFSGLCRGREWEVGLQKIRNVMELAGLTEVPSCPWLNARWGAASLRLTSVDAQSSVRAVSNLLPLSPALFPLLVEGG